MKAYKNKSNLRRITYWASMLFALSAVLMFSSCNDSDDPSEMPQPTGMSKQFALGSVSDPAISGQVTFEEIEDGSTKITIDLDGTSSGNSYPAHIHMNTAAESGDIVVSLNPVNGESGMSETTVTMKDDGSAITYDELIDYDGYINVHKSADDLSTLVAQGDIGQNSLTDNSMSYTLHSVSDPSISGEATFYERMNGETLVTLELEGTMEGNSHPAHIHMNTAAEGGDIMISLNNVDGATGWSKTNVAMLDGGDAITYDDLINYDGYINVHKSADDLSTLVAQGDIGQNVLTGESMSYDLGEKDVPGISGTATFFERMNGETLVVVDLNGVMSGDHPMHIHKGSVADAPGDIMITLNNVNAMGMSKTNVAQKDNMDMITYDDMIAIDGYINVHSSADNLGELIAQGNVGANAN